MALSVLEYICNTNERLYRFLDILDDTMVLLKVNRKTDISELFSERSKYKFFLFSLVKRIYIIKS